MQSHTECLMAKKKLPVYGPASETQRQFLTHEAQFVIYGGGEHLRLHVKNISLTR